MEIGGALGDPVEEGRKPGMRAQRLGRVVAARKFGFGKGGVDLVVADLMHKDRGAALAAAQFGDQVMQALLRAGRDRAQAERAKGQVFHDG